MTRYLVQIIYTQTIEADSESEATAIVTDAVEGAAFVAVVPLGEIPHCADSFIHGFRRQHD